jgi:VIT1/CCC1 family predicted Fe2+/Mn2+ transporter
LLTDSSQRLSPHEWDQFRHFKDRRLSWVVTSLSVAIATFLLVIPIIVLYFVTHPSARLALTITFIVAFAIGLSVTTSANRDAIFAATAAYSAVLVVFVSGDLANAK